MTARTEQTKNVSLYITDVTAYDQLVKDVISLWYRTTGQSITRGDLVTKSLLCMKNYLADGYGVEKSQPVNVNHVGRLFR